MGAPKGNKYAEGNKGGRPTKLTPELLAKAKDYLSSCKDKFEVVEIDKGLTKDGKPEIEKRVKEVITLPSVEGLARWLNVSRDTVYEFIKENEEFSDTYESVKAEQAKRVLEKGLSGDYNPLISKLILSTNHGYKEKTESDVNVKVEKLAEIQEATKTILGQ